MSVYKASGELMLGSRLRRLGDRLLADVSRAYGELGIPFEPSWFPLFFLLDRHGGLTVSAIAVELEITRSGASQMVASLEAKGLLETRADPQDGRVRVVALSVSGEKLLKRIKPVWKAMHDAIDEMLDGDGHASSLLQALDAVEESLRSATLTERIITRLPRRMENIDE